MKQLKFFLLCLVFPTLVLAHGEEDHGKDGAPAAQTAVVAEPRVETATEIFEVVGKLQDGQLSLLIDRFATNEPVLDGKVEVELNGAKTQAKYRADQGYYTVDDPAFVKALAKPGKHSLVFTVTAGNDADLLEVTMGVTDDTHAHAENTASGFSLKTAAIVGGLLALILAAISIVLARRKSPSGN